MEIQAHIQTLIEDKTTDNPLYRTLEIHMQKLGCLVPYREQLNWTSKIETVLLGDSHCLTALKKMAAKNDGSILIFAKLFKNTIYQHIIGQPNDSGIYLPFRFDHPFTIKNNNQELWIGSAPRVLDELKWMEITIKNKASDEVTTFWENFQYAAQTAIDHMSPLIIKKD